MHRLAAHRHRRPLPPLLATLLIAVLVLSHARPVSATGHNVSFDGGGWGHGIGMSQWGARGFAANGWTADRILTHYYQGTSLAGAESPNPVRVGLLHDQSSLGGSTTQGGMVSCDGGTPTAVPSAGWTYHPVSNGSGGFSGQFRKSDGTAVLTCAGRTTLEYLPGILTINGTGYRYRHGTLELSVRPGTSLVRAVAKIYAEGDNPAIDVYLYGLGEMPSSWPREALRTQAIAGRTYALEKIARLGQHRSSPPCDCALVSTVYDQAYVGYDKETGAYGSQWVEAVQSTRSLTVKYGGALIQAYYSSSSGGATENNELVWGGTPLPYLRGVSDPYDGTGGNPNFRWSVRFTWAALQARLNAAGDTAVGTLQSIQVVSPTGSSGRVTPVQSDGSGGVRIVGSSGTKRVSGDRLRGVLGLKSTLFTIADMAPADSKTVPIGGYALRADGSLVPFGGAPAATGAPSLSNNAGRGVALGGPTGRAGYVLDGFGGLHPVNGAAPTSPGDSFPFDIARDLVLRADGQSGYVLDGWGGIHPFGGAPQAAPSFWQSGSDVALRLALRQDGTSGYVVLGSGALHPFGGAPAVSSPTLSGVTAIGLLLRADGTSGFVADSSGNLHPFAAVGQGLPAAPSSGMNRSVSVDHRANGSSGYLVSETGAISAFGGALPATAATTSGATRRDIALVRGPAGYVLDGFGGLHAYGGAAAPVTTGYWSGWDIARRVVVRSDGGGYVMDGFAGLHPFAQPGQAMPARPAGGPYWPGWEIARDIVLLTDTSGYVLDGYGGIHPFGGAPAVSSTAYWRGWDIARRIALQPGGTGGYVLDGYGGLHPFAIGTNTMPAAISPSGYWSGWDIARDLELTDETSGWTFDGYGGAHPFGAASGAGSWWWPGYDLVVGAGTGRPTQGWVVYADGWGGIHTAPQSAPAVDGSAYWPGWRIARDLAALPGA